MEIYVCILRFFFSTPTSHLIDTFNALLFFFFFKHCGLVLVRHNEPEGSACLGALPEDGHVLWFLQSPAAHCKWLLQGDFILRRWSAFKPLALQYMPRSARLRHHWKRQNYEKHVLICLKCRHLDPAVFHTPYQRICSLWSETPGQQLGFLTFICT